MDTNFKPNVLFAKLDFSIDESNPSETFVKISGAFRKGNFTAEEFGRLSEILLKAKKRAQTGILVFDLSGLTYWSTVGINSVIPIVDVVNRDWKNRAGIFGAKDSDVYAAALGRHRPAFEAGRILWEPVKSDLLKKLEK